MNEEDLIKLIKKAMPQMTDKDFKIENGYMFISNDAIDKSFKEREKIGKKLIKERLRRDNGDKNER